MITNPDQRRDSRLTGRVWRRLLVGAAIGLLTGAAVGFVIALFFGAGPIALWVGIGATAFFGGCIGGIVGTMSSLESPDPGREPSQFDEPVSEPDTLTRPETNEAVQRDPAETTDNPPEAR